nr:hypothetical protein [uncultured Romboutsia sp.]
MAKHEFGIMQNKPMDKERFDEYESNKYNCITVEDDFIEPILIDLQNVDCYWHTLQNSGKGLAYCGITLIPPESMNILIKILSLQDRLEYTDLISLANQAKEENKYIIHFGI